MVQRHWLTTFCKQTDTQPVSEQWLPCKTAFSPTLFLYPSFYCQAWRYMVWNIPLANSGQLSWLRPFPVSCLPLAYILQGAEWEKRKLWHWASPVQQQPKLWCVINTVLVTNLKYSTIWTVRKKFCSSQTQYMRQTPRVKKMNLCFLASRFCKTFRSLQIRIELVSWDTLNFSS